ncbi:AAA family ATPase [Halodesulfovibrio sp.]|jgi:putative DNA primase/helicase|uniref:AAA family ATPase n=1 Tax=Halodesulfovibrio sp. TaxID=1912772 RepID=UPI0025CE0DE7|nr:AAA family ATPase [Halodesulfovibrio sp.]MCT4536041.1 AAA family ATPase [Halodesulfovibrio sp.]
MHNITISGFLTLKLPERSFLLNPIIPQQGLALLYAPRRLGKTYAALSIALAVASGSEVYDWQATSPHQVLDIDGEMPACSMQESLNGLSKGMKLTVPYPEFFQIITPDLQTVPMPNLANAVGQQSIEALIQDTKLIVMDNLATLCRNGRENESDFWMPVQSGQLDLRRRGLSVLIVHHAGKSGDQRGTPAKEDIMDTVISLKRPKGYTMQKGARFEVHLTKARGVAGEEVRPFEAQLQDDNGTLSWTKRDIEDAELGQLKKHLANGLPIREIAEEMGKSKSAIHRLKNKI